MRTVADMDSLLSLLSVWGQLDIQGCGHISDPHHPQPTPPPLGLPVRAGAEGGGAQHEGEDK